MDYVQEIPEGTVWIRKSGVYRSAKLFARGDTLFAECGAGYVRMHSSGATSVPTLVWLEIDPGTDHRLASTGMQPPRLEPIKKRPERVA